VAEVVSLGDYDYFFELGRATDHQSVAFLLFYRKIFRIKTVGGARQHLHFLCIDKETKQKKTLTLR